MNLLVEAKLVKLWAILRLQEVAIMGGCLEEVISPPESLEFYANRGCWNDRLCKFITPMDLVEIVSREVLVD